MRFIPEKPSQFANKEVINMPHSGTRSLCAWLLLLLLEQGEKADTGHLANLETHPRNITLSVARSPKPRNKDFIVFFDEVEATVARHESSHLLTVLDQLHTH